MKRPRSTNGVTLVELLVVTAIISVLAALLLPALTGARATARDTKCMANLKSIGNALMLYLTHHENFIPACGPEGDGTDYQQWYRAFLPYLDRWEIYECPSKATAKSDVPGSVSGGEAAADTDYHTVNYGMNFQFPGADPDNDLMGGTIQMADVVAPAQVLFICDGALFEGGLDTASINDAIELPDSIIDGALHFTTSVSPGRATASPRHRGHTMCLFLDGHVKAVQAKRIFAVERGLPDCFYDAKMHEF